MIAIQMLLKEAFQALSMHKVYLYVFCKFLGRVDKWKLCDTVRQFFVWQGSEAAVVAGLRQGFAGYYSGYKKLRRSSCAFFDVI